MTFDSSSPLDAPRLAWIPPFSGMTVRVVARPDRFHRRHPGVMAEPCFAWTVRSRVADPDGRMVMFGTA